MSAILESPAQLVAAFETAYEEFIRREEERPAEKHPYVYASAWRACDRRLVLEMTESDKLPPFEPDVLARFRRGHDRERDLLADLARVGRNAEPRFDVIGQQERFAINDRLGRVVIVGKVDARLQTEDRRAYPLESKSWDRNLVARIQTFGDVFRNKWTRPGGYQLLAYLYASNEPFGFMLLDRPGIPLLLPVVLYDHLAEMEEFLTRASTAVFHREEGTLPRFHDDAEECQRCPFYGSVCNPPLKSDGAAILTDPILEAQLARREELKPAAEEFEHLDVDVKERLRGVEHGIAGAFAISGKWGVSTSKACACPPKRNEKGKFTLTIAKLE